MTVGDQVMCKLVICTVNKSVGHEDPYIAAKSFRLGDVISILEDNHEFGKEELNNPMWRIISCPDATIIEAQAYLSQEVETDPQNPSRVLQRRGYRFDLSKLPIDSDTISKDTLHNARYKVTALSDPGIL